MQQPHRADARASSPASSRSSASTASPRRRRRRSAATSSILQGRPRGRRTSSIADVAGVARRRATPTPCKRALDELRRVAAHRREPHAGDHRPGPRRRHHRRVGRRAARGVRRVPRARPASAAAAGAAAVDELRRRGRAGRRPWPAARPGSSSPSPGLDGHSNGAEQIAVAARDAGMEVVYQGIRLTPEQIAAVARDEDVDVVGLSILSGSHLELVPEVVRLLRDAGVDAPVVVGGIIPEDDRPRLLDAGRRRRLHARRTSSSPASWPTSPTSPTPAPTVNCSPRIAVIRPIAIHAAAEVALYILQMVDCRPSLPPLRSQTDPDDGRRRGRPHRGSVHRSVQRGLPRGPCSPPASRHRPALAESARAGHGAGGSRRPVEEPADGHHPAPGRPRSIPDARSDGAPGSARLRHRGRAPRTTVRHAARVHAREGCVVVAQRFIDLLDKEHPELGRSAGVACSPAHAIDASELLRGLHQGARGRHAARAPRTDRRRSRRRLGPRGAAVRGRSARSAVGKLESRRPPADPVGVIDRRAPPRNRGRGGRPVCAVLGLALDNIWLVAVAGFLALVAGSARSGSERLQRASDRAEEGAAEAAGSRWKSQVMAARAAQLRGRGDQRPPMAGATERAAAMSRLRHRRAGAAMRRQRHRAVQRALLPGHPREAHLRRPPRPAPPGRRARSRWSRGRRRRRPPGRPPDVAAA